LPVSRGHRQGEEEVQYPINDIALQHTFVPMYLVALAWLYVTLMMAVVEAAAGTGSIAGAILTFVLYGALPVSLALYLVGTPGRRRLRRQREIAVATPPAIASVEPDGRGEAAAGAAVAPVGEEP
jgi:hypothetical protein